MLWVFGELSGIGGFVKQAEASAGNLRLFIERKEKIMSDKTSVAKSAGFLACFEIASVWFGSHVGGGFASGNQTMQFYVNKGPYAVIFAVIAIAITALVYRAAWMTAKENGTYEYRSWAVKEYAPTKFMPVLFEICWFFLCLVGIATSIAGAASLFVEYGAPYILGVVVMAIIITLLCIFGAQLVKKASTVMTVVMAVLMLIIYITCIVKAPAGAYSENVAVLAETQVPMWQQLWSLLKYAGFQSILVGSFVAVAKSMKTRKDVNMTAIIGFVLNGAMIALSIVAMISWLGTAQGTTLPIFTIIQTNLGNGVLKYAYSLVLLLAFISTSTSLTFGSVARFGPLLKPDAKNTQARDAIISIVFVVAGAAMSMAGLTALVSVGYGWCGVFAVPIIIIPCIIINLVRKPKPFVED